MGGCQNYGPFLGTLNIRRRIIIGIQKGTIILTTTQINHWVAAFTPGLGLAGFELGVLFAWFSYYPYPLDYPEEVPSIRAF